MEIKCSGVVPFLRCSTQMFAQEDFAIKVKNPGNEKYGGHDQKKTNYQGIGQITELFRKGIKEKEVSYGLENGKIIHSLESWKILF